MKKIELKPVDTFFFKNHQTTVTGTDTTMTGLFPPRPNTIYGALRAAYIHQYTSFADFQGAKNEEVKRWMGTPNELGDFSIRFLGIHFRNELHLPLSYDYQVIEEDSGELIAYPLHLKEDSSLSSQPAKWRLFSNRKEKSVSVNNIYVPVSKWKEAYLKHKEISDLIKMSQFLEGEEKLGIALDYDERKSSESMLYQMIKWRFKEDGSLVVYTSSSPDFSKISYARVGGENRPWYVTQKDEPFQLWTQEELQMIHEQVQKNKVEGLETYYARIILLTPAIWKNGSKPNHFDGEYLTLPNGLKVRLLTAAMGRPELYGGWDIVRNRPKTRKFMVPAGTVLYVEVDKDQLEDLLSLANGIMLTDEGEQEGFGFAIITN
ncbi:type III-B CRISPR module-associated Cmr3 family protein [Bacillus alveayuensis]|uniref:type III-B CRISPR module-associated Cmr3 family protein n=1 Tax=Aeribacillus alveayuensis TaxID=279215 RepID=UPI0005D11345|nr:type III-B CRISPR module-associated Cmr3 family protein [Bacillus alveayuensis]